MANKRELDIGTIMDDNWYPAANGTEVPIKYRSGYTLLYCWNPIRKEHAYLNCDTDIILSSEDAENIVKC